MFKSINYRFIFPLLMGLFCMPLCGQQNVIKLPNCSASFVFTTASSVKQLDNRQSGCTSWTVTYSSTGFSVLSIVFQSAPDNNGVPGSWSTFAGTVVSGSNPSTAITQAGLVVTGYYPWVRMLLSSVTGTGTIRGTFQSYADSTRFGGGGPPSGAAGGCLSGTYPNPSFANLTVAGGVPFVNATPCLAEDATNFFWNNTDKRLGLGTNTPLFGLDVFKATQVPGVAIRRLITGTGIVNTAFDNNNTAFLIQTDTSLDYMTIFAGMGSSTFGGYNAFAKSRSTNGNTHVIVQDGDSLGTVDFLGDDGADLVPGSIIDVAVDGTPGVGIMPSRIAFAVMDSLGNILVPLRVRSTGNVELSTAGTLGVFEPVANRLQINDGTIGQEADLEFRSPIGGGAAPVISGCGTVVAGSTNLVGNFTSATTGACVTTITFAGTTAPVGWNCAVSNITTANLIRKTSSNTTSITITGVTVSGDTIAYGPCAAY